MSSESAAGGGEIEARIRCPACRAKQALCNSCGRCGADLWLLAQVNRRIAWLIRERQSKLASGDHQTAARHARELRLWQPKNGCHWGSRPR